MAEVAFLAHTLHWPLPQLLDLEHADRRHFIDLVAAHEAADTQPDDRG